MANRFKKMNYTNFIEYLDNNHIKYIQNKCPGFPFPEIEVIPRSEKQIPRRFDLYSQRQIKESQPKKKTTLDFMDYKEFIKYLKDRHLQYEEMRYCDDFLSNIIDVNPISKKIEARIFFADSEEQAFEGDQVEF